MNDIILNHQVVINELSWIGVVCMNTAHLCCGQIDLIGLFSLEEIIYGYLIGEIQLRMRTGDDTRKSLGF